MKSITQNWPAVCIAAAIVLLALIFSLKTTLPVSGSTARGSEYQGTTTQSTLANFSQETVIQNVGGTLGSVVITGVTTGTITLYDATTSSVLLRTPAATSSIILASFPASAAAGTYTFDRVFFNGLYVSITGITPTTTITFRQ